MASTVWCHTRATIPPHCIALQRAKHSRQSAHSFLPRLQPTSSTNAEAVLISPAQAALHRGARNKPLPPSRLLHHGLLSARGAGRGASPPQGCHRLRCAITIPPLLCPAAHPAVLSSGLHTQATTFPIIIRWFPIQIAYHIGNVVKIDKVARTNGN